MSLASSSSSSSNVELAASESSQFSLRSLTTGDADGPDTIRFGGQARSDDGILMNDDGDASSDDDNMLNGGDAHDDSSIGYGGSDRMSESGLSIEGGVDVPKLHGDCKRLPRAFAFIALILIACAGVCPSISSSLLGTPACLSSHCSGLGGVEIAVRMITDVAPFCLTFPVSLTSVACFEMNSACAAILKSRAADCCIFRNMFERWPAWDRIHSGWEETAAVFREGAPMPRMPCKRHLGLCQFPHVMGDVTGTPCQPWSRSGKREGKTNPRAAVLLAWIAWLLHALPFFAIHENVLGFDVAIIDDALGHVYNIWHIYAKPSDLGFHFLARPRVYSVLILRSLKILCEPPIAYNAICSAVLANGIITQIPDCLIATDNQLLEHENTCRTKRGLPPVAEPSHDWAYLLTAKQQDAYLGFMS
jgi:hypothetical protein